MSEMYEDIHSRLEGKDDFRTASEETLFGPVSVIKGLIIFISAVIISLLALRLIFIVMGTSSDNGLVSFIYTATNPLVVPFTGVLDHHSVFGAINFDPESLPESSIAIIVSLFVVWILNRLLSVFYLFNTKKPSLDH